MFALFAAAVVAAVSTLIEQEATMSTNHPPGTPLGIPGHRPAVPIAGGVDPWCECGYRWDRRDPDSLLVGQHIEAEAKRADVPINTPGQLR